MQEKSRSFEIVEYEELTYQKVKEFLVSHSFKLNPSQRKISFPKIMRIHKRYQHGARYSEIKVREDGCISDGHHRFISLALLKIEAETIPAGENITKEELLDWKDIILDEIDYDTLAMRRHYEKQYDQG